MHVRWPDVARLEAPWEELGVQLAAQVIRLVAGLSPATNGAPASTVARVTRAVRMIERHPDAALTLQSLAREAGLSPYHFLRTFERVTGLTPHQYLLRARLRQGAMRLAAEPATVLDIALDCGFGDVSNFNRAFHAEFGVRPRVFRLRARDRALREYRPVEADIEIFSPEALFSHQNIRPRKRVARPRGPSQRRSIQRNTVSGYFLGVRLGPLLHFLFGDVLDMSGNPPEVT